MIILNDEQGSPEWLASRLGRPSASMFGKLITGSGKPSSSAESYINEMIAERLTGRSKPFFTNEHMERGTALEPEAREAYEFITDFEVVETGFILDDSEEFGCSPDGLVFTNGRGQNGLEIKCPSDSVHVSYLRAGKVPAKYYQQVQGCMWITGMECWDFMSYHPEMPHLLVRMERNEKFIEAMAEQVLAAVETIKTETERLV
jgi:putative phage-type endonuclease